MANWLVLDEELKPEWEREASALASAIVGRPIEVTVVLPTEEQAREAYLGNVDLLGQLIWRDESGEKYGVWERLPFHGVFILNNQGSRYSQAVVWNSYLEQLTDCEKQELERLPENKRQDWIDDLSNRRLRTFPRQLLRELCRRIKLTKDDVFDGAYWDRTAVVPLKSWLLSSAALVQRVRPHNASDLMSQICGVRRYVVSRHGAMGFAPEKRLNHPSYDGRICPVDTPESEMVGISLQLARGAWVDKEGMIHPTESAKVLDRISWGAALVPFSHHNDGARNMMGAKNLRQATPVLGRERPVVRTGAEKRLAEKMAALMRVGVCPDSTDQDGEIAMGRDLLVAYLPWNGWNLDDAIVVNKDVVDQGLMSVKERKSFSRPVLPKYRLVDGGKHRLGVIKCGEDVARFKDSRGNTFTVRYNDAADAVLTHIAFGADDDAPVVDGRVSPVLTYEIEKVIPLGRGDKLMARHGNKGVVGKVEDKCAMPRLPDDPRLPAEMRGRAIDILVNPHGVLSRMNPGQLLETHLGWLIKAAHVDVAGVLAKGRTDSVGAPEVNGVNFGRVQDLLEKSGLDRNGRIKLVLPNGEETENPVVVGYEHFVRLHHIPELKAQARAGGEGSAYNAVTMQPAHGRKCGGGQRIGEMEVWALNAHGAYGVLEEMLGAKSDKDWAAEWCWSSLLPSGRDDENNDKYGFTHLLRDWLRALCIDLKVGRDNVEFGFLTDAERLIKEIGEERKIVSKDACKEVETGRFGCSAKNGMCNWMISGEYPLSSDAKQGKRGNTLKFGVLIRELGFDRAGVLCQSTDGSYTIDLTKDGQPAGALDVELENYKPVAQTLNIVARPSKSNPPAAWPTHQDFQVVYLRAKPAISKEERESLGLGAEAKSLPADVLLEKIQEPGSGRSVESDFSVVCPHHHLDMIRLKQARDVVTKDSPGGLFDRNIFDGKDSWGYIELPFAVPYPYRKTVKGRRQLKSVDKVSVSVIPVLPLHYRKPSDRAMLSIDSDDISHYYLRILQVVDQYKAGESEKDGKYAGRLQRAVADLFEMLGSRLEKKHGFLRHDGLGRRVDRSFRLVITPNPELKWDQVGVPTAVLWEMLGDRILDRETFLSDEILGAHGRIERRAGWTWHNGRPVRNAYPRIKRYLENHPELVILLNRQPSLHRDSMQAFHPVAIPPEEGESLQLSPLCCEGFAADFDGDEMAGHCPVSTLAQLDAQKLLPSRNLRSIATGDCLAHLDRDLVTGLELIHRNPEKYAAQLRQVDMDNGAIAILRDRGLAPGEFAKRIFGHWCETAPEAACDMISALSRIAFRACTSEGVSFGFFDLLGAKIAPKVAGEESGAWIVLDDDSPFAVMVNAEANGSKQIRQVVKGRGLLEIGKRLAPVDIGNVSLIRGMPWREYFAASQNARYSMSQKKIGTQKAGALTRQLVLGLWGWTIDGEACKCADGERSVVNCRSHERPGHEHAICAKCFGRLPNGQDPEPGMPIGLVAAQTLGERGTQLSMRVFHAGSAEVDIETVSRIMTGISAFEDADSFVSALRQGAYSKIDRRYFELLWRELQSSPNKKLSGDVSDPFTSLARGSQMEKIRELAKGGQACSLDSPIAKVLFNLFGARAAKEG